MTDLDTLMDNILNSSLLPSLSRSPQCPFYKRTDPFYEEKSVGRYLDFVESKNIRDNFKENKYVPAILSSLIGYHNLTSSQLGAIAGRDPADSWGTRYLKSLFDSGFILRGRNQYKEEGGSFPHIWALPGKNKNKRLLKYLDNLSPEKWVSITGGVPTLGHGSHVRHNVLGAELALRGFEVLEGLQAIFPESLSAISKLLPGVNRLTKADVTFVRKDGLRIALEITQASSHIEIASKFERWISTLENKSINETGLVVCFVNASMSAPKKYASLLRSTYKKTIFNLDKRTPSQAKALANAIYLTDWSSWFPSKNAIDKSFANLLSYQYDPDFDWFPVPLLGGVSFSPQEPSIWQLPGKVVTDLACTPQWADF